MGVQEAVRLTAVREAVEGRLSIREGMRRTGLSRSQFLRYKKRYRRLGPRGLVHAGRGRPSVLRLAEAVRERVLELLADEVALNDCHIRDLPAQGAGDQRTVCGVSPRAGNPRHAAARGSTASTERQAQEGAMLLVDGVPSAGSVRSIQSPP
jgi:hypothetical protein